MRKTVLTYGTFDLFHYGHLRILERASGFGENLIVGLSTDQFNEIKGKSCFHSYKERKKNLDLISVVNKIIPEESWDQKITDIKKYNIDVFVMGDDWLGKFDYLKEFCEVIYLARTPNVSTTLLKSFGQRA